MLEVIAHNISDLKSLSRFKQIRIEFCSRMEHGGLLPDWKDLQIASKMHLNLAIMVRFDERFDSYTNWREQINDAIKRLIKMGYKRLVIGYLIDRQIDPELINDLKQYRNQIKFTFHRAFEQIKDQEKALKLLQSSPVDTILTSFDFTNLKEIQKYLTWTKKYHINFLVGGGVSIEDIPKLKDQLFDFIHLGRAIRINNSWDYPIDKNKLKKAIKLIEN